MNTVFKHIERKIYAQTFLQQVDVRLEYNPLQREWVQEEDVISFFNNHFQIEANFSTLLEDRVFLKDNEQQLAFLFSSDAAMLSVGYLNYRSFYDSVLPNVYHIKDFVFNLWKQHEVTAAIRKVNVFSMDNNINLDEDAFHSLLYETVFSSEFLQVAPEVTTSKIDGNQVVVQERSIEDILFRTYIIKRKNGVYSLFLETIKSKKVVASTLEETLEGMNVTLYDAFHWSVGANIIAIMDKEEEK